MDFRDLLRSKNWSKFFSKKNIQDITNIFRFPLKSYFLITVFLIIWKRDRDRRVHEPPHQNAQG